jgi:hypothetical protein
MEVTAARGRNRLDYTMSSGPAMGQGANVRCVLPYHLNQRRVSRNTALSTNCFQRSEIRAAAGLALILNHPV